jgi:tetratricopeptide (TPR) repeat protein
LEIDPHRASAHNNLGLALQAQGDLTGAVRCFRAALDADPKLAVAHYTLGNALKDQGDLEGAARCYRAAIALDPKLAVAHTNLGNALKAQGDLEGALRCYRAALDADPKLVTAHYNLGLALAEQKDLEGAVRCFRTALEFDPKDAPIHNSLGNALKAQGDVEGALRCYRAALEIDPKLVTAHYNLGLALAAKNDLEGALRCYRAALALDPKHAQAHNNVGNILKAQGDVEGALRCYRTALDLNPRFAPAHFNLGSALREKGLLAESLAAYERGHELRSKDPRWPYRSAQWVREARRLVELDDQLPAVLRGEAQPADAAERIEFAQVCRYKQLYGAAARFYESALAAKPEWQEDLKTQHRYNAACAAALAGCGQGRDDPPLDEPTCARWRQQALAWLQTDLAAYTKLVERGKPEDRTLVPQRLRHWQRDPDLAGVRNEDALARLPEAEREAWRRLWADVAETLAKAREKTAAEEKRTRSWTEGDRRTDSTGVPWC